MKKLYNAVKNNELTFGQMLFVTWSLLAISYVAVLIILPPLLKK
ncbi:hypothetical protein [Mucilaginibacter sp.]